MCRCVAGTHQPALALWRRRRCLPGTHAGEWGCTAALRLLVPLPHCPDHSSAGPGTAGSDSPSAAGAALGQRRCRGLYCASRHGAQSGSSQWTPARRSRRVGICPARSIPSSLCGGHAASRLLCCRSATSHHRSCTHVSSLAQRGMASAMAYTSRSDRFLALKSISSVSSRSTCRRSRGVVGATGAPRPASISSTCPLALAMATHSVGRAGGKQRAV